MSKKKTVIEIILVGAATFAGVTVSHIFYQDWKSAPQNSKIEYRLRDEFDTQCIDGESKPNWKIVDAKSGEVVFFTIDPDDVLEKHSALMSKKDGRDYRIEDGTYQICRQHITRIAYGVWSKDLTKDEWLERAYLNSDKDKAWNFAVQANANLVPHDTSLSIDTSDIVILDDDNHDLSLNTEPAVPHIVEPEATKKPDSK